MAVLGSLFLVVALALAGFGLVAGVLAAWFAGSAKGINIDCGKLGKAARWAGVGGFAATTLAAASLVALVLGNNFSVAYVADHSNRALPVAYKFAALWAGQEGSLLLWAWLLALYAVVLRLGKPTPVRQLASAILAGIEVFFLLLLNFTATPFSLLVGQIPDDGNGLNPLLQYPEMVIHPPLLYLGYVGFAVPFALALGGMMLGIEGREWLRELRRWTLVAWLFLTCGIFLGMHWAYAVLGWGGYWGWDPVENASLMPWLTGTAYLHTLMMEEKRGMMKGWNRWLIFSTFMLTVLGTLLTRGGLVSSVHAFAHSSIGNWFICFLVLVLGVCLFTAIVKGGGARSEAPIESLVSRESSFLYNNLVLLAACLVILWGTLFPVLSEYFAGTKITLGPEFYNGVEVPIGIFLLLLTGIGPLLPWRKPDWKQMRRRFVMPVLMLWLTFVLLITSGLRPWHDGGWDKSAFYALICVSIGAGVMTATLGEFLIGVKATRARLQSGWLRAFGRMLVEHHRRYGGYTVHLGVVVVMAGLAGAAFNLSQEQELKQGAAFSVGPYTLVCTGFTQDSTDNYDTEFAMLDVKRNGVKEFELTPERRVYLASQQPQTMVAIHSTLLWDLYVVYEGANPDTGAPVVKAFFNPLVSWIWVGLLIMVAGSLLSMGGGLVKLQKAEESEA